MKRRLRSDSEKQVHVGIQERGLAGFISSVDDMQVGFSVLLTVEFNLMIRKAAVASQIKSGDPHLVLAPFDADTRQYILGTFKRNLGHSIFVVSLILAKKISALRRQLSSQFISDLC